MEGVDAPLLYEVRQGASHDPGQDIHGDGGDEAATDAQPAQVVGPGYLEISGKLNVSFFYDL